MSLAFTLGLDWQEVYGKHSPATVMLFLSNSTARSAISRGLEAEVGKHWEYSSGSTNALSSIARRAVPLSSHHSLLLLRG